jgi:NAD(P)-dependent dehydrogenase (short-subunit alcohol dehydrogenase family)
MTELAKSVIVTGASSGIGATIAQAFAGIGAQVVLVGRHEGRLDSVANAIAETRGSCEVFLVDLVDEVRVPEVVAFALESFGRLDVLVHSAGIYVPQPVEEISAESFDQQWAVHVRAPFFLTQAALPHLQRSASIIFISSQLGQIGATNSVAYCSTKGAVELMSRAMAVELAPRGIRVNCIAPGLVKTRMNEAARQDPVFERQAGQEIPLGRMGTTDEIAPLALFLASEAASYITGASIAVDGGSTAD